jgi:hypothetical protein
MAAFPPNLPKPNIDNYGGVQDLAFIRTEMEAGSMRQRQRYTATNHQMTMSWLFRASEMAIFKTFFDTTINKGADFFTMELDVGDGFQTYDTRFTAPYQYTFVQGNHWSVSINVEVRGA